MLILSQLQRLRRLPRIKDRFHSSGLTSLSGHVFSKLLNILGITLLAPSPYQPRRIMIKGGSITLTSKDILLRFPTQIQAELRYLWNSGLALRAISSMTPMEESKPPSLVETCLWILQKVNLPDESHDNIQA